MHIQCTCIPTIVLVVVVVVVDCCIFDTETKVTIQLRQRFTD